MKVTYKQRIIIFLSLIIPLYVLIGYTFWQFNVGNVANALFVFFVGLFIIFTISFIFSILIDDDEKTQKPNDDEFHSCCAKNFYMCFSITILYIALT